MTILYSLFFSCYIVLFSSYCFGRSTYSYFTDQKTEAQFRGFKTLWKPYTQLYTLLYLGRSSKNLETTTLKTTYITIDGNIRTPIFLSDSYYDEGQLATLKKQLILREIHVNGHTQNNVYRTRRFWLVNSQTPKHGMPPPFKEPPDGTNNTSTDTNNTSTDTTGAENTTTTSTTEAPAIGAYCYVCGLDNPGIQHSNCYNTFDNPERIFPNPRRFKEAKMHCIDGEHREDKKLKRWYGKLYRGGCFKRFTDVGYVYNERGCRTKKPFMGSSFASKRFAKLEKLLYGKDNGCVFSPHAVLTPFSRPISLYVRYHVCVCKGKYCNRATDLTNVHFYLMIVMLSWQFWL